MTTNPNLPAMSLRPRQNRIIFRRSLRPTFYVHTGQDYEHRWVN